MEAPAPAAQGVFTKTPFSNLLVYAMDKRLSGTMELAAPEGQNVTVLFIGGVPAKARLSEAILFLGDILVELGFVTDEQHQVALAQHQVSGDLYGQALFMQGLITEEQLMEALATQLSRKVEYVFSLAPDTSFAYYEGYNALEHYGADDYPQIDPLAVMWAGIRANPPWEHVHQSLTRIGNAAVRLTPNATPERFGFGKVESAAVELMRNKPHRMFDLTQTKILGPTAAQLLVYCLLITRQVDLIEVPPSIRPPPASVRPGTAPGQPGSLAPPRLPGTLPQPQAQMSPPTGSAFAPTGNAGATASTTGPLSGSMQAAGTTGIAKVQLKQAASGFSAKPGVAVEQISTNPHDKRLASSMPEPMPSTSGASGANQTGANQTGPHPASPNQTSLRPASVSRMVAASAPSASKLPTSAGASSTGNFPAAPKSAPGVHIPPEKRAELEAKRKVILEKAATISSQNYYEMLGVKNEAKPDEVQKAFFALAKEFHPDRLPAVLADVKDACSKVFAHMSEANQTLSDPKRRGEYTTLLKDGGASPDEQAKIQAVLDATTNFSKAEHYLKRNDLVQAELLCRKAYEADPTQADYIAMLAWIEAQKPANQDKDQTRARIAMLDRAVKIGENCEKAYFYRGMLNKRLDQIPAAMKDFKMAADLNPRNLDAMREIRLYQMRKDKPGASAAPANSTAPSRGSMAPKPKGGDTGGGLFGKLFKK